MFKDKKTLDTPFSKGEKVVATEDLRRVPAGTPGKVKLVNGFEWTRYWVFFDNGEKLGSIDGSKLVRPPPLRGLESQARGAGSRRRGGGRSGRDGCCCRTGSGRRFHR